MSLPPEVEASFVVIIDSILAASDLDTISEKRIRRGLQESVEYDITPQKSAIKALIMARFDKFDAERRKPQPQTNGHTVTANGVSSAASPAPKASSPVKVPSPAKKHKSEVEDDDEELSDVRESPAPKKKRKVEYDSDAAFAAKLQAQENGRIRSTRGGGPKAPIVKKKKTPKKKTAAKVHAEDDSDLEGSGAEQKKVNKNSGFHKELILSPALSALLDNEAKLSRPQTVKRIWAYVRARDLQDPSDKRMIRCDDAMRAVFKQEKVHMFTMNKILAQNMYNTDE